MDDVAVVIYTGGTTGLPKGVMLTFGAHIDLFATFLAAVTLRVLTMEADKAKQKLLLVAFPIFPAISLFGPLLRLASIKKVLNHPKVFQFFRKALYDTLTKPEVAKKKYKMINCRKEMAGYKIPRSIVFVEELPYSPAGKLLRQKAREIYGHPRADSVGSNGSNCSS